LLVILTLSLPKGKNPRISLKVLSNMGHGQEVGWSFGSASFLCIGNSLHLLQPFARLIAA
jgi:hypothetical protein